MATLDRLTPPNIAAPVAPSWTPRRAIAAALTLVAAIALVQVLQSSNVASSGQQQRLMEQQRSQLQASIHILEADVASLSSLDRVERAARERLGMVEAQDTTFISVTEAGPSSVLLPRPLPTYQTNLPQQGGSESWWRELFRELPLP